LKKLGSSVGVYGGTNINTHVHRDKRGIAITISGSAEQRRVGLIVVDHFFNQSLAVVQCTGCGIGNAL
jgi:hypothetical protein